MTDAPPGGAPVGGCRGVVAGVRVAPRSGAAGHRRRAPALTLLGVLALALGGCGGGKSIVAPRSTQSHVIALLWWWMLGAAAVVFLGAVFLLGIAWIRRRSRGLPLVGEREDLANRFVLLFGIVIPLAVLLALFGASDIYAIRFSEAPRPGSTRMAVAVIGHQWWWEVRYPGTSAVTANEIHVPARTRVRLVATTADVIHSLWVPQLARKIDMIPGRENEILLDASRPGTYEGQCSEFCGPAHADMQLRVVAERPAAFSAWLANMARPATLPGAGGAREGEQLFFSRGCSGCHQLRGTEATATVGPDLTHLATRGTLAAVTIPNDPAHLEAWIRDPQAIKPGNRMPDLGVSGTEAHALATFLESLR
jgi:cytochrome c oxidase subunit 2